MRSKKLLIGIIVLIAFIGLILVTKAVLSKSKGVKPTAAAQAKKGMAAKGPAKKVISKGKGGLTVKILNSKNTEIPMRVKVFKVMDGKSSVYATSTVGSRMEEVNPGTYDIEIDTVPQKLIKGIKVDREKETVENLGCVTGSVFIKTANSKKKSGYFPMRVLYPKTNDMVTAYMTDKSMEIIPGVYDIEIGTAPRQLKKDIKVGAGKDTILDLGCLTGSLVAKVKDENGKDVRCAVRIIRKDTNELISSSTSNRAVELGGGVYNVDILSSPKQSKKDVKVNAGEESIVEFTVKAAPVPQKQASKTAKAQ